MATLDTLQDAVNSLTSSTTTLVNEVQVKKATLDASVADAQSAQAAATASASTASGHATSAAASAAQAAATASGIAGFDLTFNTDLKARTDVLVSTADGVGNQVQIISGPSSPTTPVASSAGSEAVTRLRYPISGEFRGARPCRRAGVAGGRIVSTTTGVRRAGLRGSESRFDRRT